MALNLRREREETSFIQMKPCLHGYQLLLSHKIKCYLEPMKPCYEIMHCRVCFKYHFISQLLMWLSQKHQYESLQRDQPQRLRASDSEDTSLLSQRGVLAGMLDLDVGKILHTVSIRSSNNSLLNHYYPLIKGIRHALGVLLGKPAAGPVVAGVQTG